MAFFEKLGNRAFGVDDSWGPLRLARAHDPDMRLVRGQRAADALRRQHLRRRVLLLRRRALRGGTRGAVPRDPPRAQAGRPVLRRGAVQQHLPPLRGQPDPDGAVADLEVARQGPRLHRVPLHAGRDGWLPAAAPTSRSSRCARTTSSPPWQKGLFCDLCDVGCFFGYEPKPPYEFGPFGTAVARFIRSFGLWHSAGGIFYVARAKK